MSVKLLIPVPNISEVLALNFDFIRIFRSTTGALGDYVEITSDVSKAAVITGTVVGPWIVDGTVAQLRANRGEIQEVNVSGTDPLSATQVAESINAQTTGIFAEDDGSGKLKISTVSIGIGTVIEILGDETFLETVGFLDEQTDTGESGRIPLVANVTEYLYEDVTGTPDNFYKVDFINSGTGENTIDSDPIRGSAARVVPKQQADTRAPRGTTLIRGTSYTFRHAFFADAEQTIPLEPLDASRYPSFQIVDINGQIVQSGLAVQDGAAGNYRVEFFAQSDAAISNDDRRWRIEWVFVDTNNRQIERFQEFDVRDVDITRSEIRDQKLTAMCDKPFRVYIREMKRPFSLRLDVENANNPAEILVDGALFPGSGASGEELITESTDNETFVYYYNIGDDLLRQKNTYRATWTIEESIGSAPEYAFQIIVVPPPILLQFFPSLRMVIDKFQKRREHIQAYQDSDVLEYLTQGINVVNGWHPLTSYQFESLPEQLFPFWLLASQMWALNAQHLLETDLQFSFCIDGETLVRTDRGLTKAKHLAGINQTQMASQMLVKPSDIEVFRSVRAMFESGKYLTQSLVDACGLDMTAQQLGLLFSKFNLNDLRSRDGLGSWLWDVKSFWTRLSEIYGIRVYEAEPLSLSTSAKAWLCGDVKPMSCVWDLGTQDTLTVTTKLGYEVTCTPEHGFLVLDPETLATKWLPLNKIRLGDIVAIDATPEPDVSWDIEFDDLSDVRTATSKIVYDLPSQLTPELSRILGYFVSEGCNTQYNKILFGCADQEMLRLFRADFKACFGLLPSDVGYGKMVEGSFGYDPSREYTDVFYVAGEGVELRRFLASVGLGYGKSREKEIPWCILSAPLHLAAEFLKSYLDGDGCIGHHEIIFCSFSDKLRSQLQSLLLRFGIVSRNDAVHRKVTVRGPSLQTYIDRVGFRQKDQVEVPSKFYPQREALPFPLFEAIRNLRGMFPQVNAKGWYAGNDGSKKRARLYWDHGDHYAKHTTWRHVESWWKDGRKETIAELDPVLRDRIEFLLDTRFLWQEIVSIEEAGSRHVLDPSLPEADDLLAHGFSANGIVTHNSGQTVTLDYDHTGNIEAAIQRAVDFLQNGLTAAKTPLLRRSSASGVFAGRGYRFNSMHNFVFQLSSYNSGDFVQLLSNIGLLAVPLVFWLDGFTKIISEGPW